MRIVIRLSFDTDGICTLLKGAEYSHFTQLAAKFDDNNKIRAHLLDYADDKQLRQVIQESLNRGEQLQGLKRALASLGGNQFRGKSPDEMTMWNSCADLLANCIVYYNAMIMSSFKSYCLDNDRGGQLKYLRSISPASWDHLLLSGFYDLSENDDQWDIESEIRGLNLAA